MPRGMPDDSDIVRPDDFFVLQDMAELAARLGSPIVYDRYGSTLFMSDFATGLEGWEPSQTALGATWELAGSGLGNAPVVCRIDQLAGVLSSAGISKVFSPAVRGPVGIGSTFSLSSLEQDYHMRFYYQRGGREYRVEMQYIPTSGEMLVSDFMGNMIVVGTAGQSEVGPDLYHYCKLIVDIDNHRMLMLHMDDVDYPVQGWGVFSVPNPGNNVDTIHLFSVTSGLVATQCNIASVVMTMSERD